MTISVNVTAPGAIPDRDTLIALVQEELDRDDLADKIPVFIQFVEAICSRKLRTTEMERTVVGEATDEDTPLPSDYRAMRAIYEEGSPDRPLKGIPPTAIREISDGTPGTPIAYTLVSEAIRLIPPPDSEYMLAMDYWASIEPLSIYTPSNWLLEKHPDVYFYGVLYRAEHHLQNVESALQYKLLFEETITDINKTSRNDRYGAGPLVPSPAIQVRGAKC
jgi:hypothetical protein